MSEIKAKMECSDCLCKTCANHNCQQTMCKLHDRNVNAVILSIFPILFCKEHIPNNYNFIKIKAIQLMQKINDIFD